MIKLCPSFQKYVTSQASYESQSTRVWEGNNAISTLHVPMNDFLWVTNDQQEVDGMKLFCIILTQSLAPSPIHPSYFVCEEVGKFHIKIRLLGGLFDPILCIP